MPIERTFEPIVRPAVPALDAILGEPIRVLDDGFVRVVDYMGDDAAIVQAARVSYGKGTRRVHEDRALIRYLMRHDHTTPFEMCEIKLHVRVPMDIWRQWIRHRTASVNEYSTRYSEAIDARPAHRAREPGARSRRSTGRAAPACFHEEVGARLSAEEVELQERARAVYEGRLAAGVAREQARKDLPLATFTEAYWKIDLHNLLHFLEPADGRPRAAGDPRLRDHHRRADRGEVGAAWRGRRSSTTAGVPRASRAPRPPSSRPSRPATWTAAVRPAPKHEGWLPRNEQGKLKANLERAEFEEKLVALGLTAPWSVNGSRLTPHASRLTPYASRFTADGRRPMAQSRVTRVIRPSAFSSSALSRRPSAFSL